MIVFLSISSLFVDLVPMTSNRYPLKRIVQTDIVWLSVTTFCHGHHIKTGLDEAPANSFREARAGARSAFMV